MFSTWFLFHENVVAINKRNYSFGLLEKGIVIWCVCSCCYFFYLFFCFQYFSLLNNERIRYFLEKCIVILGCVICVCSSFDLLYTSLFKIWCMQTTYILLAYRYPYPIYIVGFNVILPYFTLLNRKVPNRCGIFQYFLCIFCVSYSTLVLLLLTGVWCCYVCVLRDILIRFFILYLCWRNSLTVEHKRARVNDYVHKHKHTQTYTNIHSKF